MSEEFSNVQLDQYPIGMVTNFHVYYSISCAVCDSDFHDTTPNEICRTDEAAWANNVRNEAIKQGWKDYRDEEALCPTCVKGDYLAKHELHLAKHALNLTHPDRKRARDARKAKEAVLAVTRQTWMQKLGQFLQRTKP